MARDTSRIKIKWYEQKVAGTGTLDTGSDVYACVTDGPNWSGFTRGDVETTCSNTTLDGWGNLIRTFQAGKIVDLGTVTFTVDWDPDNTWGGRELAAFFDGRTGDLLVEFPAGPGETSGPVLVLSGHVRQFTPMGTVLTDDDGARSTAEIVFRISGLDVTAPV